MIEHHEPVAVDIETVQPAPSAQVLVTSVPVITDAIVIPPPAASTHSPGQMAPHPGVVVNSREEGQQEKCCGSKTCVNRAAGTFMFLQVLGTVFTWNSYSQDWWWALRVIDFACLVIYGSLLYWYNHQSEASRQSDRCCGYADASACILMVLGVLFTLICLCCCFDADSKVWRIKLDGHTMEEVLLRELALGDSVLSLNPATRETYWESVRAKVHYSAFDGGHQLSSMRALTLATNASITLSHTHFIFVHAAADAAEQQLVRARDVRVGDRLLHHDVPSGRTAAVPVVAIDEQVMRQKRSFFLTSPFVLVNNISASPYMGAHPAIAAAQHACYSAMVRNTPNAHFTQAVVTATSIPFLLLNNFAQFIMQMVPWHL